MTSIEQVRQRRREGSSGGVDVDVELAVREVYLAHFGALAGWAGYLVSDANVGHDLATDAFVKLINHWPDVDRPRPWLYATVSNLVKDHWRKLGRERAALERVQQGYNPDLDVVDHGPDMATIMSVRSAVESLPERLRQAVLLHYFGDLTMAEVARQLGKAEGTVKRDLHDARALLARTLESAR